MNDSENPGDLIETQTVTGVAGRIKSGLQKCARLFWNRLPGKTAGGLGAIADVLMMISALVFPDSPNWGLFFAGLIALGPDINLVFNADRELALNEIDPQDWPLKERLTSPRKCPWELVGLANLPFSLALLGGIIARKLKGAQDSIRPTEGLMGLVCLGAFIMAAVAEKKKEQLRQEGVSQTVLATVHEKPLAAVAVLYALNNIPCAIEAFWRGDRIAGIGYLLWLVSNPFQARSHKRAQVQTPSQPAPDSP